MSTYNCQEIIILILIWICFAILCEALNEIIRTATPLEGLRAFVSRRSKFIAQLISCGYCTSVWVGFSLGWILPPLVPQFSGFGDRYLSVAIFVNLYFWWFINGIILHRLSNYIHDWTKKSSYVFTEEGQE